MSKLSKVEIIKAESRNLRGPVNEEVENDLPYFTKESYQILKFHGTYQQDHRDLRKGRDKHWMFMVRGKLPGGRLTADQYLAVDEIADWYGDGTIRFTTRQAFQLYGVIKKDLKRTFQEINKAMITTLGACGDVVRNVMATPAPDIDGRQSQVQEFAGRLSDELLPASRAYHEIWLDEEKVWSGKEEAEPEPLYGKYYLPRKFKIALTIPEDNSIDIYTQDVGLIALFDDENRIEGFNIVAGGGLGMQHKKPDTYPRLGDHLGYVPADRVSDAVKAIVAVQRDLGNRENRKLARMKYLIDRIGLDTFRKEVEKQAGFQLEEFREIPEFKPDLYLGWNRQSNGKWFLGISVENGRVKDDETIRIKSALRKIAETYKPEFRLTPNQNVLITDILEEDKKAVEELLESHGVLPDHKLPEILKHSMACPALPTCGLAIAESERIFPALIRRIHSVLEELGLEKEVISVRMTGCPNGCARPYVADIAFVGRSLDKYTIFIGGNPAGTRLVREYKDLVHLDDLVEEIRPLLSYYKENRRDGEGFGDFWAATSPETLQQFAEGVLS